MRPPRTVLENAGVDLADLLLAGIALAGLWALVAEAGRFGL